MRPTSRAPADALPRRDRILLFPGAASEPCPWRRLQLFASDQPRGIEAGGASGIDRRPTPSPDASCGCRSAEARGDLIADCAALATSEGSVDGERLEHPSRRSSRGANSSRGALSSSPHPGGTPPGRQRTVVVRDASPRPAAAVVVAAIDVHASVAIDVMIVRNR